MSFLSLHFRKSMVWKKNRISSKSTDVNFFYFVINEIAKHSIQVSRFKLLK